MKWFKPKYSVCRECAAHFEPRNDQWADLCLTHRQPIMERDMKRDAVTQWARENWEKLYEQYEKDYKAKQEALNALNQAGMSAMQAMAAAQNTGMQQSNVLGIVRGLGGF